MLHRVMLLELFDCFEVTTVYKMLFEVSTAKHQAEDCRTVIIHVIFIFLFIVSVSRLVAVFVIFVNWPGNIDLMQSLRQWRNEETEWNLEGWEETAYEAEHVRPVVRVVLDVKLIWTCFVVCLVDFYQRWAVKWSTIVIERVVVRKEVHLFLFEVGQEAYPTIL